MKSRPALLFVGAAAFFAALAAGSYTAGLWTGDGPDSAEANPAVIGICNVSVSNIPDGVKAFYMPQPVLPEDWNTPTHFAIRLILSVPQPEAMPLPTQDPQTGVFPLPSSVGIDAATGELVFEDYRTAGEEATLREALAMVTVGPWQPAGPAWPRTDTAPTGEVIGIRKPVEVLTDYDKVILTYREPDALSGLIAGTTRGDSFDRISAFTCDSIVEIDGRTGSVNRDEVTPDERAMFDRFLSEVRRG
jgi:hypothetical protein